MDEIRAERLIAKHGSTCDALFYIIYKWPKAEKYQEHPELIPSLEHLVRLNATGGNLMGMGLWVSSSVVVTDFKLDYQDN